jgi:putative ABC transport system substrate-binding protein
MRRREFIAGLGGASVWPLAARAQQQRLPIIGHLHPSTAQTVRERLDAFHRGLADQGYVEGRNLAIEYRWAEGHIERLPELAADLLHRPISVLAATGGTPAALAAAAATKTVPVVFAMGGDPVALGLVASLAHPGGNVTWGILADLRTRPKARRISERGCSGREADRFPQ